MISLVTFLITTYNSQRWLNNCLNSVLNQTYKNLQVLIIDDGSDDSTVELIKNFSDKRIELFCREHSGISKSLNFAIDKIKGDFVARIDSDDFCDDTRISKQMNFLELNPSYGIVGSNFFLVNEVGNKIDKIKNPEFHEDIIDQLPRRCCIWNGSIMLRTKILKQLNGFNQNLSTGEDWDFFLRAIGLTKFYNIPEFLTYKRIHPSNISNIENAKKETERILLNYNNSIIEKSKDKELTGKACFNIGYHYYYENDFRMATEYFRKSIDKRGLTLRYLRYFLLSKYLNGFLKFFRENKLYKLFYWLKYFDKNNKYLRNKF